MYIIIYAVHPYLNIIIEALSKAKMLVMVLIASFLYFGLGTIMPGLFFSNELTTYIVLYFDIAYIKKYLPHFFDNLKVNCLVVICSIGLLISAVVMINYLGLDYSFFRTKLLRFDHNQNILIVIMAFCLFNLFKCKIFISKTINYISGLTLFIYIIHENILVRQILRPLSFVWIKDHLGYEHIILWVLMFSLLLFILASVLSLLYKVYIEKLIKKVSNQLYEFIVRYCEKEFLK